MFSLAGNTDEVVKLLPDELHCDTSTGETGSSLIVCIASTCCGFLAAFVLISIFMVERSKRGDGAKFRSDSSDNQSNMLNIPPKPQRLRATCATSPNIKAINKQQSILDEVVFNHSSRPTINSTSSIDSHSEAFTLSTIVPEFKESINFEPPFYSSRNSISNQDSDSSSTRL